MSFVAQPLGSRALLSLLVLSIACAHVPKRNPLPEEHVEDAEVLGIPRARFWGDVPPPWMPDWWEKSDAEIKARYSGVYGREHNYLAISGGGENGAFAGGLLLGWAEAGDRPEFTAVTGISAGALIAPFAFLGTEYDSALREILDQLNPDAVLDKRRTLKGLRSDAMASTEPLRRLIETYIDQEMMERIAEEHRKGRELSIGTTNLDSMRSVNWRIGRIANSGHPGALELIQQVILASASIPGAFPPVLIEVQVGDERFDELHVDGGAASQVFLYPAGLDWKAILEKPQVRDRPNVYLIRNSRLDPMYEQVDNKLFPIAGRSIESLVRTQGIGDLHNIYLKTCRDGLDFNLAYIPADFVEKSREEFDPEYMKSLFDMAFDRAGAGYPWEELPPELKEVPPSCR
jgi:hypothetical protein